MVGTKARTRTAGTLSGSDIGTTVTVSTASWVITGVLHGVGHEQDGIETVGESGFRSSAPGMRSVDLTIGPWSGEVSPDTAVDTA